MSGPIDFAEYISAEKAYELHKDHNPHHSLEQWRRMARNSSACDACGQMPAWRYAGTGMCFPCTTGESDASDDYELILMDGGEG